MADRVAVVTGGGSGIGAAVALALARDGWRVVIVGRREQPLAELAAAYPDLSLDPITADVTAEESVRSLFAEVVSRHAAGGPVVQQRRDGQSVTRCGRCAIGRVAGGGRPEPDRGVPVHSRGVCGDAVPATAGRADHQQRLHLGSRPAPRLGGLRRHQARDHRADQGHRAGRAGVRHRLRPDRHRQRRDRHDPDACRTVCCRPMATCGRSRRWRSRMWPARWCTWPACRWTRTWPP